MTDNLPLIEEIVKLQEEIGTKTIELDQLNKQLSDLLMVRLTFGTIKKDKKLKKRMSDLLKEDDTQ